MIPVSFEAWGFFYCPFRGYEDRLGKDMAKDITERVRKAQDKALECLDYILETIPTLDFVEIVGRDGSDTVTYRVYNDGSVYEK